MNQPSGTMMDPTITVPSNVFPDRPLAPANHTTGAPGTTGNSNSNNNSKQQLNNLRISLVVGFGANMVLFVGYVCNLAFSVFELNKRDRESVAIMFYFVAFALLILSGLIELGLDVFSTRLVGHGRYCDSNATANKIISVLFLLSSILDIIAFVFWMKRDFYTENIFLFASGYTILIMATIVIYFQNIELRHPDNKIATTVQGKTDYCANLLVLVATVLNVAKVHLDHQDDPSMEDLGDRLEFSVAPFWLVSALLFVITDLRYLMENIQEQ